MKDVFGISKEARCAFFSKIIRHIAAYLYDKYVKLSELTRSGKQKFVDSCKITTVGVWGRFQAHVDSQLKANFSFKKSTRLTLSLQLCTRRDFCVQSISMSH